jgi:multidrug efflux pump subunit AcrA (membrane-fusion protein)
MNGKKSVSRKTLGVLAVLLLSAVFVLLPSLIAGCKKGAENPEAARPTETVFSVRTAEAALRDLTAYIEVNGNIINESQIAVNPDAAGRVASLRVGLGQTVRKGEIIGYVDPSRPGQTFSLSPVLAPVSGKVISVSSGAGSTVSTSTAVVTIAGQGGLAIEAFIPEREVGQLKAGLEAAITLQAFPGETFAAFVTTVSPVVDPNSRTKKILLAFSVDDGRINEGMFAHVKLNTRLYKNAVTVPSGAVVEIRGTKGVYVLDAAGAKVRFQEVSAGVTVDGETELRSGVEAGMTVVTQGQQFLTDGAAVRVIGGGV